jgi:predicted phosphodiesterase
MNQRRQITRREMLRIGGVSLVLCPWSRAAESRPGFEFIVVNDTHFVDAMCQPWHEAVAAAMRESAPEAVFCAHAGDLADAGDAMACVSIKEIYGSVAARLYAVPGNHDYIRGTDRSGYDAAFPSQLNYVFQHMGWQILALDTTEGTEFEGTEVPSTTIAWLDEMAPELDVELPTFVFTHFPLGDGAKYRPRNADAVIGRLEGLNVRWIHSGHWHAESVRKAGKFPASTSRCCARLRGNHDGSLLKGWYVYRAEFDGKLSRRFAENPKI